MKYFIVNAFTTELFTGNPAAVCLLNGWLPDSILQNIAEQNNLSETVFFVKDKDSFHLRWFTPIMEVPLCGHATLAAAHIIFQELKQPGNEITFSSLSGDLIVTKDNDVYTLNFPSDQIHETIYPDQLIKGISSTAIQWGKGKTFFLIELKNEEDVWKLNPDFTMLQQIPYAGIIVTAKGNDEDFVLRVFAPQSGINEDPVTGSALCLLIPYWSQKLNKQHLIARQISKRGGILYGSNLGNRVLIGGKAQTFASGFYYI